MGARWYDPTAAQFRSRDTIFGELSTPVSLNRYTYGFANPLVFWDRDRLFATSGRLVIDGVWGPRLLSKGRQPPTSERRSSERKGRRQR
jgi:hypothetical protein